MIIFVRNIPVNSQPSELEHYVASAVRRRFFFRSGKILRCEILVLRDKRTRVLEFHGLVYVDSDRTGHRAIQKLKGKRFNSKLVTVREYKVRSWQNDRRLQQTQNTEKFSEKRTAERRLRQRVNTLQDASKLFSSSADFSRKLI